MLDFSLDRQLPAHVPAPLVVDFHPDSLAGTSDPFGVIDSLFGARPIVYSRAYGGFWIVTGIDLVREVLQRGDTFSSYPAGLSTDRNRSRKLIPLELDRPEHTSFRQLLASWFSPNAVAGLRDEIRRVCVDLIDPLVSRGGCEVLDDLARPLPAAIFCRQLGLPQQEALSLAHLNHRMIRDPDPERRRSAFADLTALLTREIAKRRADPRNDLLTVAATGEVDGRSLTEHEAVDMCFLLCQAGLDTVAAVLGFSLEHLSRHPAQQALLREEPAIIAHAVEELLRAHAVVNTARTVRTDLDFHGVALREGDRVLILTALACRDPRQFESPTMVDLGRNFHGHLAFGAGPHRCLGANLARAELAIALEEVHRRLPPYRRKQGTSIASHGGGVIGLDALELVWS